jgi:hypothetical protein
MAVLRFLLIFFLVIFIISYIIRVLLRVFFKRMESNFNQQQQGRNSRPEGDVSVSKPPKHDKLVDKDVGDYVDYEEVDE